MNHHVVIVGAGITGLSIATGLQEAGVSFTLLESNNRCGGRIFSPNGYDMGPAWFWPGQQHIVELLNKLDIDFYPQQDEGLGLHQTTNGTHKLPSGYIPMAYRVENGLAAITDALRNRVGENNIRLNHKVTRVAEQDNNLAVFCRNAIEPIIATHVILALPPRLVEHDIRFTPVLNADFVNEIKNLPTWMAGNAKALVTYDSPFWYEQNLSGTAFSQMGPLVQIHEATLPNGNEYALFGFIGDLPLSLRNNSGSLKQAILDQLTSLFGENAKSFRDFHFKDWSEETHLATPQDSKPLREHPRYGISQTQHWGNRLMFAGTETVTYEGGLIEGALISAKETLAAILNETQRVQNK